MAVPSSARIKTWQPPVGWVESKAGIYTPPDYLPSDYELQAPAITSRSIKIIEWEKCHKPGGHGLSYFAFKYCWTVDVDDPTDDAPKWRRFPAYPYLRTFFFDVATPANVHVRKSRQMSLSWAWMIVFLYDLIFREEWPALVISRRSREVDDGGERSTKDSLLGKMRLLWSRLPEFLAVDLEIKKYMLSNHDRGNHVKGETGNLDAGRGSTFKRALLDEAAHVKHGETVFAAVRAAAKTGTILNGTPEGKDNVFFRIYESKATTFRKLRYHWTEHPRYSKGMYCTCGTWTASTGVGMPAIAQFRQHASVCPLQYETPPKAAEPRSPAYDKFLADYGPERTARELDISFEGSKAGRVYTTFIADRHVFDHTAIEGVGERGEFETLDAYKARYLRNVLDPLLPLVIGWDFGVNKATGLTVMVIGQEVDPGRYFDRWLDVYANHDQGFEHYAEVWGFYDAIWREIGGYDYHEPAHYGDPSGTNRDSRLDSWITNLASAGIIIDTGAERNTGGSLAEWIEFKQQLQRRGDYQVSSYATFLIDANEQYSYPIDRHGMRIPGRVTPVHNEWSHPMDGERYVYRNRYGTKALHNRMIGATSEIKELMGRHVTGQSLGPLDTRPTF